MPKGTAIEILTARDDAKSPSFFIEPPVLAVTEKVNRKLAENDPKRTVFQHPIGVERITEIRIVKPKAYKPLLHSAIWRGSGFSKPAKEQSGRLK